MDPTDLQTISATLEDDARTREKLREAINELEKKARQIAGTLNKVHGIPTARFPELTAEVQPIMDGMQVEFANLASLVRPHEFWRMREMWSRSVQSAVFSVLLCEWLNTGTLATLGQVTSRLGIKPEWSDRFILSSEEYLHGVISLTNELSRLAVNAVIMKDFQLPAKIYTFVKELQAGFSLLNLKNDPLRRRFDSIKYDVKRIEEVVYDISLRQLGDSTTEDEPKSDVAMKT